MFDFARTYSPQAGLHTAEIKSRKLDVGISRGLVKNRVADDVISERSPTCWGGSTHRPIAWSGCWTSTKNNLSEKSRVPAFARAKLTAIGSCHVAPRTALMDKGRPSMRLIKYIL